MPELHRTVYILWLDAAMLFALLATFVSMLLAHRNRKRESRAIVKALATSGAQSVAIVSALDKASTQNFAIITALDQARTQLGMLDENTRRDMDALRRGQDKISGRIQFMLSRDIAAELSAQRLAEAQASELAALAEAQKQAADLVRARLADADADANQGG